VKYGLSQSRTNTELRETDRVSQPAALQGSADCIPLPPAAVVLCTLLRHLGVFAGTRRVSRIGSAALSNVWPEIGAGA